MRLTLESPAAVGAAAGNGREMERSGDVVAAHPSDAAAEAPQGASLIDLYPRIQAYARRFVVPPLADDVAQEVCLRLLMYKAGEIDRLRTSFLVKMTRNTAISVMTTERRRASNAERLSQGGESDAAAEPARGEPVVLADRRADWLNRLLDRLSPRQREAFELTTARGLSEKQAGLALSMSRAAVSARRRDAIDQLRRFGGRGSAGAEPQRRNTPGRDSGR